ncbi:MULTISPECIES: hypothetical protein [unclassified Crossiella]|uniref:hypothetical protein n=1 Tax=unclassified Crossiella TaxID=2620835 RepID=UPI001FFF06D3|nr:MULTISPECIES: hypothetical protein [unclassified Crossiella]MCK2242486.1 hypothetical protein [Crossiella sp. S99.2]MCK2254484.1 hypothetical protein [Crossiella sp. S99.1]
MDYTTMEIEQQVQLIEAEIGGGRVQQVTKAREMWTALHNQLSQASTDLHGRGQELGQHWLDSAGHLFGDQVQAGVTSLTDWTERIATEPASSLANLAVALPQAHAGVMATWEWFQKAIQQAPAMEAELRRQASQNAGVPMNQLAALFTQTAEATRNALGTDWRGPQNTAAPNSPANATDAAPGAPTGAPPGAPPGGPAGAPPGGPAGAPPGGAPGGAPGSPPGAPPAPPGGPSLAGGTPTPAVPKPTVPPPLPSLPPPVNTPPLPLLPPVPTGGLGGAGGLAGARGGGVKPPGLKGSGILGPPPIPRAAAMGAAVNLAPPPEAPVAAAGTTGSTNAANSLSRGAGIPPMAPPLGGAGVGGNQPKPGSGAAKNAGTAPGKGVKRGIPGVPARLGGQSAGVAAVPTGSRRRRAEETTTIELLDEEMWRVEGAPAASAVVQPEQPRGRRRSR